MNNDLINKKHCKEFAKRYAQDTRTGWLPERVSEQFLEDLNSKVRLLITGAISRHPTVGKTIKYLF